MFKKIKIKPLILVLFVGLFFVVGGTCFAELTKTASAAEMSSAIEQANLQKIASIIRMIYSFVLLILPMAGSLLNNSIVYGGVLGMDEHLYKMWNMVKVFANYGIGLVFIFSILASFFTAGKSKMNPVKMLPKILIASVLVQLSWFLVGVMVDLSSVLTYTVGGLPFEVIKEASESKSDSIMLKTINYMDNSKIGSSQYGKDFVFLYEYGGIKMLPCYFYDGKIINILDQDDPELTLSFFGLTEDVLNKKSLSEDQKEDFESGTGVNWSDYYDLSMLLTVEELLKSNKNNNFCVIAANTILNMDKVKSEAPKYLITNYEDYKSGNEEKNSESKINTSSDLYGLDPEEDKGIIISTKSQFVELEGMEAACPNGESNPCPTMGSFTENFGSENGMFSMLFGSILNMADFMTIQSNSTNSSIFMEAVIKLFIFGALMIPLVVLLVILFIRVVFMWLLIAFSPLLMLTSVFDFKLGDLKGKGTIKDLLSMVFLPAIVTGALSISVIFLSILSDASFKDGGASGIKEQNINRALGLTDVSDKMIQGNKPGVTEKSVCYQSSGIVTCLKKKIEGFGFITEYFTWIVINIFGICIMRILVFAALKTGAFTKKIVDGIDKFAKDYVQTVKVLPGVGGSPMSLGGWQRLMSRQGLGQIPGTMQEQERQNVINPFIEKWAGTKGSTDSVTASMSKVGNGQYSALAEAMKNNEGTKTMLKSVSGVNTAISNMKINGVTDLDSAINDKDFVSGLLGTGMSAQKLAEYITGGLGGKYEADVMDTLTKTMSEGAEAGTNGVYTKLDNGKLEIYQKGSNAYFSGKESIVDSLVINNVNDFSFITAEQLSNLGKYSGSSDEVKKLSIFNDVEPNEPRYVYSKDGYAMKIVKNSSGFDVVKDKDMQSKIDTYNEGKDEGAKFKQESNTTYIEKDMLNKLKNK